MPDDTDLDLDRAAAFLGQSRSRFLREGGRWLVELDDPADVLILLSGDVGQHLGPWDCFRHCALLGLHHSEAVKALALDVLNEPPDDDGGPPIAPAFAVAWAHDRFPEEGAPHAQALLALLERTVDDPRVPTGLTCAARLALCGAAGAAPEAALSEVVVAELSSTLSGAQGEALAVPIWEAAVLSGAPLVAAARSAAARGQQPDGGLTALADNVLLRGFATLRGLALAQRAGAPAP